MDTFNICEQGICKSKRINGDCGNCLHKIAHIPDPTCHMKSEIYAQCRKATKEEIEQSRLLLL